MRRLVFLVMCLCILGCRKTPEEWDPNDGFKSETTRTDDIKLDPTITPGKGAITLWEDEDPNSIHISDEDYITIADMDVTFPTSIIIGGAGGGEPVVIDLSGKEVIVRGANEEGARIFFVEIIKPMIDDYIRSERQK